MLYPKLPVSTNVKERARELLDRVDAYLDGGSHLVMEREVVSRLRVLEVTIYGGMAHANHVERKGIRDHWAAHPALDVLLSAEFIQIMLGVAQLIFALRRVNLDAIAELTARTG